MSGHMTGAPSTAKAWRRALELTAPIVRRPERTLPVVIDELAHKYGAAAALLSDDGWLTYAGLARQSRRYAQWALEHGLEKGDAVALLMPNRPDYLAMWLGVTRVGGIAALLNTNLRGQSLAHCINLAAPRHLIVDAQLIDRVTAVRNDLVSAPMIWIHGGDGTEGFPRIDDHLDDSAGAGELAADTGVTIADRALYIYTSGTTGLPKAANVSHARVMPWTHRIAGPLDVGPR